MDRIHGSVDTARLAAGPSNRCMVAGVGGQTKNISFFKLCWAVSDLIARNYSDIFQMSSVLISHSSKKKKKVLYDYD